MTETKKSVKKSPENKAKKPKVKKIEEVENGSFAVLESGGKQYKVSVGDTIKIEKMKDKEYKEGDNIIFDKIIMVDNGVDSTDIGAPYINGAKVSASIVSIGRDQKITVIKYKQKSRYFKKNGHRQPHFMVKINSIA